MGKPKRRDSTVPPGFGGHQTVSSMWFPHNGYLPSGMGMPPGMMPMPSMMHGQAPRAIPASSLSSGSAGGSERRKRMKSESDIESRSLSLSRDSVVGESTRKKKKRRKTSGNRSDDDVISSNYRFLGGKHINGEKTTWPKVQKIKVLRKCNEDEFNPLRLASMEDDVIDQLVYLATNCPPSLKIADLKINTKGELRRLLKREHDRLAQHQPVRFKMLSPDYGNLEEVVVALGYPKRFLMSAAGMGVAAQVAEMPSIPTRMKNELNDPLASSHTASFNVKQLLLARATRSQGSSGESPEPPPTGDDDGVDADTENAIRKEIEAKVRAEIMAEQAVLKEAQAEKRKKAQEVAVRELRAKIEAETRQKMRQEMLTQMAKTEDMPVKGDDSAQMQASEMARIVDEEGRAALEAAVAAGHAAASQVVATIAARGGSTESHAVELGDDAGDLMDSLAEAEAAANGNGEETPKRGDDEGRDSEGGGEVKIT